MKRKITLLMLAASSVLTMTSQVVLSEDFTSPFNLSASGWTVQNNGAPSATTTSSWFQGNPAAFTAFNGGSNNYYAANFQSLPASTSGTISNWLITPTVSLYNGAILEFATRTAAQATVIPDRMQVRMSTAGTASAIPAGAMNVGTFTDLLLDINPNLSVNNTSVVSNGSVNGYPQAWSVYTLEVTGITGTVTGRFAFRHFVDDGGPLGNNSNYIGLDGVRYTLPCNPIVNSYTVCPGVSATLSAMEANANTTFLWDNASTSSSIIVNPSSTTVYTLFPGINGVPCGNEITATVTIGQNLNVEVAASATTICAGRSVTLSATSAGQSYNWGTTPASTVTGSSNVLVHSPMVTTSYTVGALSGFCFGTNTITINVNPNPVPTVSLSPACIGGSITIALGGADSYMYLGNATNPKTIATPTAAGGYSFAAAFINNTGCSLTGAINFTVNDNPVVQVAATKTVECTNKTVTLTASGADTYSWSGSGTGTVNPLTVSTGSTVGTKTYVVVGTATTGCQNTAQVVITTSLCSGVGLAEANGATGTAVYPNPFVNEVSVDGLQGKVEIFNALGQVVISVATKGDEKINTSELPKGTYILKATNTAGETVKMVKLLKN